MTCPRKHVGEFDARECAQGSGQIRFDDLKVSIY